LSFVRSLRQEHDSLDEVKYEEINGHQPAKVVIVMISEGESTGNELGRLNVVAESYTTS
jgi:hypothetical protein